MFCSRSLQRKKLLLSSFTVLAENSVLYGCRMEAPDACWLFPRGYSQVLEAARCSRGYHRSATGPGLIFYFLAFVSFQYALEIFGMAAPFYSVSKEPLISYYNMESITHSLSLLLTHFLSLFHTYTQMHITHIKTIFPAKTIEHLPCM